MRKILTFIFTIMSYAFCCGQNVDSLSCCCKDDFHWYMYKILFKESWREEEESQLIEMSEFVKSYPDCVFELIVHTDTRGSSKYNAKMSYNYASYLKFLLESNFGVDGNQIKSFGYGKSLPVLPNASNEVEHSQNRRTELRFWTLSFTLYDYKCKSDAAKEMISEIAEFINAHPNCIFSVCGYFNDDYLNFEKLMNLSLFNASYVRFLLVKAGANPDNIVVKVFGDTHPSFNDFNSKFEILNNRVEIRVE